MPLACFAGAPWLPLLPLDVSEVTAGHSMFQSRQRKYKNQRECDSRPPRDSTVPHSWKQQSLQASGLHHCQEAASFSPNQMRWAPKIHSADEEQDQKGSGYTGNHTALITTESGPRPSSQTEWHVTELSGPLASFMDVKRNLEAGQYSFINTRGYWV